MEENYCIGNVLSIEGNKVHIIMKENSSMFVYFFNGEKYNGVINNGYIGIIRGPYKIVGRVEKESLEDNQKDNNDHTYSLNRFKRIIEVKIIGYFDEKNFVSGLSYLPLIYNEVVLLSEIEIKSIYSQFVKPNQAKDGSSCPLIIGSSLQENIPIPLNIFTLFNTHLGIFGNTGSGKSNTLAYLYTKLFKNEKLDVTKNSKFLVLDFNGEYIGEDVFDKNKEVINLNTESDTGGDKIKISEKTFWNSEFLSVLFDATEKTQKPFISNMLKYKKDKIDKSKDGADNNKMTKVNKIINGCLTNLIEGYDKQEILDLLKIIFNDYILSDDEQKDKSILWKIEWFSSQNSSDSSKYYYHKKRINPEKYAIIQGDDRVYFNSISDDDRKEIKEIFENEVREIKIDKLTYVDELIILVYSQLIYGLRCNDVQFNHINPLLIRIKALKKMLERTMEIGGDTFDKFLKIISFKGCEDPDAKQILPLLICKDAYDKHKHKIDKTFHLIIDEAHNILSKNTTREAENYRDYRLDVFEKIIKEGRKFGFYLTISSQRPRDISSTIVSQIHNYFIHRLVNEHDIDMLTNTITTLDKISFSRIPDLAPGECIITGTSFNMSVLVKVDRLPKGTTPNSENADLERLWRKDKRLSEKENNE